MTSHIYLNPGKYSKNNSLQYNFAMKALSKISFYANARVLDIGCGDGIITNEIAKIVNEGCVIGTDVSIPMVEYASKKYFKQENLRFLQMDATRNIFRCQFDIITSFNCLHWIKDHESVLSGIATSAVGGAQILLLFSHKKSLYHVVLDKICSSDKWVKYFVDYSNPRYFFDPDNYKGLVLNSGLSIVDITEEEMTYYFETKEQLKDFFSAAGAQTKLIPEKLKNAFLNDFADEFLKQINFQQLNMIPVSFWCLQITASNII